MTDIQGLMAITCEEEDEALGCWGEGVKSGLVGANGPQDIATYR